MVRGKIEKKQKRAGEDDVMSLSHWVWVVSGRRQDVGQPGDSDAGTTQTGHSVQVQDPHHREPGVQGGRGQVDEQHPHGGPARHFLLEGTVQGTEWILKYIILKL